LGYPGGEGGRKGRRGGHRNLLRGEVGIVRLRKRGGKWTRKKVKIKKEKRRIDTRRHNRRRGKINTRKRRKVRVN